MQCVHSHKTASSSCPITANQQGSSLSFALKKKWKRSGRQGLFWNHQQWQKSPYLLYNIMTDRLCDSKSMHTQCHNRSRGNQLSKSETQILCRKYIDTYPIYNFTCLDHATFHSLCSTGWWLQLSQCNHLFSLPFCFYGTSTLSRSIENKVNQK